MGMYIYNMVSKSSKIYANEGTRTLMSQNAGPCMEQLKVTKWSARSNVTMACHNEALLAWSSEDKILWEVSINGYRCLGLDWNLGLLRYLTWLLLQHSRGVQPRIYYRTEQAV